MYKRNSGGYGKQFIFKRINSLFSTPTWVYIVLTFLTGTFLSFGIQNGSDLTKNVGYSLLASLIAAVLIDAGNTKIAKNEAERQLRILTAEYRNCILELRYVVILAYENRYGIDNSRRSFSQWLDKALADDYFKEGFSDEDFFDVSWEIEWGIMRINNACTILKERFMEHISIVTNEERKMVGHVGALCTDIERYMDARNYKLAKNLIQEKLIPSIIEQNPNYKVFFEREYRWDEYEVVD